MWNTGCFQLFNFHSCLILKFQFWVIHCNPGVALSYLEWWFEIIWKGWVNKLSREHHLQHLNRSLSSMSHWFPVWFSAFNLRWSPQLALTKEALVLVIHGQNAGSDGGSYQFTVVKVFFTECRWFWCLELMIAVNGSFGSSWMQYRSIVSSSMLSIGPWCRECIHLRTEAWNSQIQNLIL